MAALMGGKYAALMGKKEKKQNQKPAGEGAPAKPKAAKTISLKDTAEKKPAPHKTHVEAKKNDQPKQEKSLTLEKDLTKREAKQERVKTDRHVPRHNNTDHTKEKKNEQVSEALEAAAEKPEMSERQREFEERDAERKKREEEDQKKVTYADYQKSLEEKKIELAQLNARKGAERKVDSKTFAAMTEMKKDEDDSVLKFGKAAKVETAKPTSGKPVPAKKAAEAPAKKGKFVKSSDIQLGFFSKPSQPKRENFRRRDFDNKRDGKREDKKQEAPAAEAAPASTEEQTPAAEATETTEAAAADEW